ncbi:ATP-binding cassette domain-containing protein [Luedemannella flava]|uniref:ATP-binding cassette domain-containing protein n=1 Tax=Luedemannella flava TaxID=349316 RepID=A0ABP4YGC0_9ACTN
MGDGGAVISARGLVKRFDDFTAVDGIDVEIAAGESFGFLGPNGAGKSSTMRMIGCVSPPSGGDLRIFGLDPVRDGVRIRSRLGVCPQDDSLDHELTAMQNITTYARYFGVSRAHARKRCAELLDWVQLGERARSRVGDLSGGMRRRLAVARSLVNDPDCVLLDEPTTGLDPQARHLLWERLFQLKRRGVTLVLTTHYMDEAEQLCDRIVIMDGGRIVAEGSPHNLIKEHVTRDVVELRYAGTPDDAVLATLPGRVEKLGDRALLYADDGDAALAAAHRAGLELTSVFVRRSTLEDVFLRLTGRTLVD